MNLDVRNQRLAEYRRKVGSSCGIVSAGLAAWLLDVGASRVYALQISGFLRPVDIAGQRLISFSSVEKFAKEKRQSGRPKKELLRAIRY